MGSGATWVMDVVGPAVLLIVLLWFVIRGRPGGDSDRRSEEGSRDLYKQEERRRREGTDDL